MSAPRGVRLRLVPVGAACWIAALTATGLPPTAAPLAAALWGGSLVLIVLRLRRQARRGPGPAAARRSTWSTVLILALLAAAASASHVALAAPGRASATSSALEGGRAVTVHAIVTGKVERRAAGDFAFDAFATGITTGSVRREAGFEITIRVQRDDVDLWEDLDVGAEVTARGTARGAGPGDRAVLAVSASRGVAVNEAASGPLAVAADLRRGLVASTTGLPPPGAGLVPGLSVGDTSAVSPGLDAAMKSSSLSHLTAVSGANCALVVGLAFAAAAGMGASRGMRVGVGLAALGGFVLLVTPEPSVVRAAAMAGIAMIGVLLGRAGIGMAVLTLAVSGLLICDPWLSGSLGFALSCVATASLLLFARPLADGLTRRMPRVLALALAVPLAAQLACGPLLVLITPSVPLYGVVANLLSAPAAPVATIVGLAACLSAPFPWVQSGLAAIAWLPAAWIAGTAVTIDALPGDQLPWLPDEAGASALAFVSGAIGVLIVVPPGGASRRVLVRRAAGVLLASVIGVCAGGAALSSPAGRWTLPAAWTVLACDVGQGDAILLRSSGVVALIDTGPDPDALTACLTRAGVSRIELLVLTHFDADHVGGIDAVIGAVDSVIHGPPADDADRAMINRLITAGAEAESASAGMHGRLGVAEWRVLWPTRDSVAFPSGNDASVVLGVGGGGIPSSLFLGDLSASPQRALVASGALHGGVDIVKVAHHGSADQDPALYEEVDAAIALVTVGTGNDYGHPRDETLRILAGAGARVARTDQDGIVALWTSDGGVRLWRERGIAEGGVAGSR